VRAESSSADRSVGGAVRKRSAVQITAGERHRKTTAHVRRAAGGAFDRPWERLASSKAFIAADVILSELLDVIMV
jgi:hypothetical protein